MCALWNSNICDIQDYVTFVVKASDFVTVKCLSQEYEFPSDVKNNINLFHIYFMSILYVFHVCLTVI